MKILLTGGGTAGHVMPSVALIPYLTKYFDDILYVGSESGMERDIITSLSIPYYTTPTVKFDRAKPWSLLSIPYRLSLAKKNAKNLVSELSPDVVFSKGGYVALPTVLASKSLSIPIAIHESDYTMGLANKVSSRYADIVMTNFPSTYPNAQVVGIPLRDEIFVKRDKSLYKKYKLNPKIPTLLVTGGSSGAKLLNDVVIDALPRLTTLYNVVHLTGGKCESISREGYLPITYTRDIGELFALSDLVISRAGANTSTELLALGKKVLFVPLEHSGRGDQVQNAKYYEDNGYSMTLRQSNLTSQKLIESILRLENFQPKVYPYDRHSPKLIAETLYSLAKQNRRKH